MKYKIQDIKLQKKANLPKKLPEKKVFKEESREERDYSAGMWLLAGFSVLFLVFSLSLIFSRAKVMVEAKKAQIPVNTNFNLTKTEGLAFEVASVSGEETKEVISETSQAIERKAHGQAILYNLTNQPQKLLIETRLSTPDGKIFKTDKEVIVPKATAQAPGSIEVGVTAEKGGESYNVGLVDFKIVGFKGTAKYEKFYGRAKTPIQGGSIGQRFVLNEKEAESILAGLRKALSEKLLKEIARQTPKDYFIIPDTFFVDTSPKNFESETSKITLLASGKMYAVILKQKDFGQELASKNIADLENAPVTLTNLNDLTFTLKNKDNLVSTPSTIEFNVAGTAKIVWDVPVERLKAELAGSSRRKFKDILAEFPSVERAELKILPFWKSHLPANENSIKVTVN